MRRSGEGLGAEASEAAAEVGEGHACAAAGAFYLADDYYVGACDDLVGDSAFEGCQGVGE